MGTLLRKGKKGNEVQGMGLIIGVEEGHFPQES